MIEVTELRIGNWVQHEPYPDEKWKVGMSLLESIDLELVEVVGIPLTPEILEKSGFNLNERYKVWFSNDNEIAIQKDSRFWWVNSWNISDDGEFEPLDAWKDVRKVHQLQNLYFALTGQELTINL